LERRRRRQRASRSHRVSSRARVRSPLRLRRAVHASRASRHHWLRQTRRSLVSRGLGGAPQRLPPLRPRHRPAPRHRARRPLRPICPFSHRLSSSRPSSAKSPRFNCLRRSRISCPRWQCRLYRSHRWTAAYRSSPERAAGYRHGRFRVRSGQ